VVIFIDRQLAAPTGATNIATPSSFVESMPEHGYQGKQTRASLPRTASNGWKSLRRLSAAEQDQKLRSIEDSNFFRMLRRHTIEGMFSDPCMAETPA